MKTREKRMINKIIDKSLLLEKDKKTPQEMLDCLFDLKNEIDIAIVYYEKLKRKLGDK